MNNTNTIKKTDDAHCNGVISLKKPSNSSSFSSVPENSSLPLYDICVFIGRFQPFHNGHKEVINEGLKKAKKCIVLIGSVNEPRSTRNPFSFEERKDMIYDAYSIDKQNQLCVLPLEDSAYNLNEWIERVQKTVFSQTESKEDRVALIGYSKDNTSYYLNLFPHWDSINVIRKNLLNATDIRKEIFDSENEGIILNYINDEGKEIMPLSSIDVIKKFIKTQTFNDLVKENTFIAKYKKSWAQAPYKPTFITADACVVQSGHVLLVKRSGYPGKGLWALPGGFVNQDETIKQAMLRELKEETKIKVPLPVLNGHIVEQQVFDEPNRSSRGRTITTAFLIHLPLGKLPKIKKSEESEKVAWLPLAMLDRSQMFEDHYNIIINLTNKI